MSDRQIRALSEELEIAIENGDYAHAEELNYQLNEIFDELDSV